VYKLYAKKIDKEEIKKIKKLKGDIGIYIVTKDCPLSVFVNKDTLLKNLKSLVVIKSMINPTADNDELIRVFKNR
jgi:hypothetical protein